MEAQEEARRAHEIHQDFSTGLTDVGFKEMLLFVALFKLHEQNIEALKNKFDWYCEEYNRMTDCEEKDFVKWLVGEVQRQMDFAEHVKQDNLVPLS
jgi:hypothetical protein